MDLTELDKDILYKLGKKVNWSKKGHIPKEAIQSKFSVHQRGAVKKRIEELVSKGLIYEKPHGGKSSYGLSKKGRKTSLKIKKEGDRNDYPDLEIE